MVCMCIKRMCDTTTNVHILIYTAAILTGGPRAPGAPGGPGSPFFP